MPAIIESSLQKNATPPAPGFEKIVPNNANFKNEIKNEIGINSDANNQQRLNSKQAFGNNNLNPIIIGNTITFGPNNGVPNQKEYPLPLQN